VGGKKMKKGLEHVIVILGLSMVFLSLTSYPVLAKDILASGQMLYKGETLKSPNGQYKLILQKDGNLVLYDGGRAIWSAGTQDKHINKLVMQNDGNLVLYGPNGPLWATNTSGNRGAYLKIQNDGNLVIYKAVWSTHAKR